MAVVQQNAMGSTSLQNIITDENIHLLRLVKLVTSVGRDLMFWVFTLCCPRKNPSQTLKDYLIQVLGRTTTAYNKSFNKDQRDQIDSNPACDQFDVTLLFLAIKLASDVGTMADKDSPLWFTQDITKLEYLLKQLKDERNELLHKLPVMNKTEVEQKMESLRNDLLVRIIETTCSRYSLDQNEKQQRLDNLHRSVNQIRDQPLTRTEILQYKILIWCEYVERTLRIDGANELRNSLSKQDIIKPFSFNDGDDTSFTLQSVFSEMIFVQDDSYKKHVHVEHEHILQMTNVSIDKPSLILVRGAAGSGKSTLTRWLNVEWTKQIPEALGIKEYDLVLPLECRSRHIDSFKSLIRFLLPNTCADFQDDVIVRVLNLRILFILDGLDEMNAYSRKVVQEILELCKSRQHTLLCTSRPENTREFLMMVPSEFQKNILEITGIPPKDQAAFVSSYHNQLILQGKSVQSTEELVHYITKSSQLQEFLKLPQNLVNLVYMWTFQPDSVSNITSATEIYIKFNTMLQNRLLQRLVVCHSDNAGNLDELRKKIKNFWKILCSEALVALGRSEIILQTTSLNRLREKCNEMELNFRDVTSAFLVRKIVRTNEGSEEQLSFPHKDHHDYCAANGLLLAVTDREYHMALLDVAQGSDITSPGTVCHILRKMESAERLSIRKYQNVLKHLLGLLSFQKDLPKKILYETVELLQETGIASQGQWLDILSEATYTPEITRYIATSIFPKKYALFEIQDAQVGGYAAVMPYLTPHTVILDIVDNPEHFPQLKDLLKEISKKNCRVVFEVWHHYEQPLQGKTTDSYIQCLMQENAVCRLEILRGHVSGEHLPRDLKLQQLYVVLCNDQQATAATSTILQQPHGLKDIRVMPSVSAASLMTLPHDECTINLDLSRVTDSTVEWGVQVARALSPNNKYTTVNMPAWENYEDVGVDLEFQLLKELDFKHYKPYSFIKKKVKEIKDKDIPFFINFFRELNLFVPKVAISIEGNIEDQPLLEELLKMLSKKPVAIFLHVWRSFHPPVSPNYLDSLIQCLVQEDAKCKLIWFTGRIKNPANLPSTLTHLRISLTSDLEFKTILPRLYQLKDLKLKMLYVQVTSGVTITTLMPLPDVPNHIESEVNLDLPDITPGEEEKICVIAKLLQPTIGYNIITFPLSKLDASSWKKIIEGFHQRGIKMLNGIGIPECSSITKEEMNELNHLSSTTLGVEFRRLNFENTWHGPCHKDGPAGDDNQS